MVNGEAVIAKQSYIFLIIFVVYPILDALLDLLLVLPIELGIELFDKYDNLMQLLLLQILKFGYKVAASVPPECDAALVEAVDIRVV